MAIRKAIKTLMINGNQVTPAGDASFPVIDSSWEAMDNLDDSTDYKYNPQKEPATYTIALDEGTRKVVVAASKIVDWGVDVYFRDGSSAQQSGCAITAIPALDGDGAIDIQIHGAVRWV